MNGDDRPGRGLWRTPPGRRPLAAVRQDGDGVYELVVAPGAGVPDLVAAAATLPRCVVFTGHRQAAPAAPGDPASVLVFEVLPPTPDAVPARPSTGGRPPLAPRLSAAAEPPPECLQECLQAA